MTNHYGNLIASLVAKYPIRNTIWIYHPTTNAFTVEASTLSCRPLDPWDRPLPSAREAFYHGQGEDRELGGHKVITTVNHIHVELTIFND